MEFFGGTAGWSYVDWHGPFYPEKKEKGFSELKFYADFFDCVEVNSTFYRHFLPSTSEKWLGEVRKNPRFVFIVKIFKDFTHGNREVDKEFLKNRAIVNEFLVPFQEQGKLAGVLVQFSEYFRENSKAMSYIALMMDMFHDVQLFFELRHMSWYTDRAREFLVHNGVNVVAVDQPQLEGMAGFNTDLSGEICYVRFHGRNARMWELGRKALSENQSDQSETDERDRNSRYNYLYSSSELDDVEKKIRKVKDSCERTYLVMNNHPLGKAVANALELVRRLRDQEKIRVPDTIIKYFPELGSVADKVDVGPLGELF